jgi:predicted acylesterase/phospholipase RssA
MSVENVLANNKDDSLALIMKGGGVKGLAYVGAIHILQSKYYFDWYVGTSAGAITAILLAAGYTVAELKELLQEKRFSDFFDAKWYQKPLNLLFYRGIHPAKTFTDWLDNLLAVKLNSFGRVKLEDLPKRVTVYACTRGKRILTFDSRGINKHCDAAYAARCSMSIPYVFIPESDQGFWAYDGGLLMNYPVSEVLSENPKQNFIGLYLGNEIYKPAQKRSVFSDIVSIYSENADAELVQKYRDRTVVINPEPVGTLDFDLDSNDKELLLKSGMLGALKHLHGAENAEVKLLNSEVLSLRRISEENRASKLLIKKRRRILKVIIFLGLLAATIWYVKTQWLTARDAIEARTNQPVPIELLPDPTKAAEYPPPTSIRASRQRSIENTVLNYENISDRDARLLLYDCSLEYSNQSDNDPIKRFPFTNDLPLRAKTNDFFSDFPPKSNWYGFYIYDIATQKVEFLGFLDLTTRKSWNLTIDYNRNHFFFQVQ